MAVAFVNATAAGLSTSSGVVVVTHTAAAGTCLVVGVAKSEAGSLSSVIANGVGLTRRGFVNKGTGPLELWVLTSPSAGNLSISANTAASARQRMCIIAATYSGQKTTGSPFGTVASATATAATVNFSVSSTNTDLVAAFFGISANTTLTVNNGNTRASITATALARMVLADITGAASISFSASAGTGTPVWGMLGVPIIASAVAAPTDHVWIPFAVRGLMGVGK